MNKANLIIGYILAILAISPISTAFGYGENILPSNPYTTPILGLTGPSMPQAQQSSGIDPNQVAAIATAVAIANRMNSAQSPSYTGAQPGNPAPGPLAQVQLPNAQVGQVSDQYALAAMQSQLANQMPQFVPQSTLPEAMTGGSLSGLSF